MGWSETALDFRGIPALVHGFSTQLSTEKVDRSNSPEEIGGCPEWLPLADVIDTLRRGAHVFMQHRSVQVCAKAASPGSVGAVHQYSALPLPDLILLRRILASSRRSREAAVGFVGRLALGAIETERMRSLSLAKASILFNSWLL